MKKLVSVLLVLALFLPVCALAQEEVSVYNWEDYICDDVLEMFEEETGIHVNYICFTMNEDMMVQVEADPSNFDVVFPSDYCIQRMTRKGLLEEIDKTRLEYYGNIREDLLNPSYDPDSLHSVPYMCGTMGILYNTDMVDAEDVKSWSCLWDPKYAGQVMMMDSIRDTMGLALKSLGYSMNTSYYMEVKAAADLLIAQKQAGMVKQYGVDELKDKMVAGEAAMAIVYSGDAEYAIELAEEGGNVNLAYSIPEEGSNIWVDAAVIPVGAKNLDNAYKFIDFLCRPDIAQMNIEEIWYMCVNQAAIDNMGEDYSSLYVLNPTEEEVARCEYYNDLDENTLLIYNTLWQTVKNAK